MQGRMRVMSDQMFDEFVGSRQDVNKLSPQQLASRTWIEENIPRAPPGSGLLGQVYNVIRQTAVIMTTVESSGYFERTEEVQRYEESALGSWSPGGMIL